MFKLLSFLLKNNLVQESKQLEQTMDLSLSCHPFMIPKVFNTTELVLKPHNKMVGLKESINICLMWLEVSNCSLNYLNTIGDMLSSMLSV